jgi:hypothetical protein
MSEAWTPHLPAGHGESTIKKAHFFSAALWPGFFSLPPSISSYSSDFARSFTAESGDSRQGATTLELQ